MTVPLTLTAQRLSRLSYSLDMWCYCNFTKINTPPWVFFMFFELYKWYEIAQHITYYPFIINFKQTS